MLPKLFIRDSKGKAREWSVRTEGEKIIVSHGLVGGKITDKVTKAKAKNIGKANETTPESQALLEAQAKWTYQIDREDYHEDIDQAGWQLRPMLALDYLKVPHRVRWEEAVAQPKLDGLRLTAGLRYTDRRTDAFEMMTRKGETYHVPHMIEPCTQLLDIVNEQLAGYENHQRGDCLALDGEAYIHGIPLQTITSLARKYQEGKTEELGYHLFDLVVKDMGFIDRYKLLKSAISEYVEVYGDDSIFAVVPVHSVNPKNIDYLQGKYMTQGFEGLMIRHESSQYAIANRSPDLFKYKQFFDDEFKIIGVWEDQNGNAMFECETLPGKKLSCDDYVVVSREEFDCTPKRPHSVRKKMLKNPDDYIGKWIKVKYQALTIDKKPQFPVGLEIRECDDEGNPLV